jgi:hypothetical protein
MLSNYRGRFARAICRTVPQGVQECHFTIALALLWRFDISHAGSSLKFITPFRLRQGVLLPHASLRQLPTFRTARPWYRIHFFGHGHVG